MFENRVLRRILGPMKNQESGENCIMNSFIVSYHHTFLG
jgi:hypothetical protein